MNKKNIFNLYSLPFREGQGGRLLLVLAALLLCFAKALAQEAYVVKSTDNTTLTFYYDTQRSSRTGTTYSLNTGSNGPGWYTDESYNTITTVVFDSSFKDARPTSTYAWFCGMEKLTNIIGISYLDTKYVTNMDYMFSGCSTLTTLDLSSFDTRNVTDMHAVFALCSALTTLDLSSFNTANVTDMRYMFADCSGLLRIFVGSGWSTASVTLTNSEYMFRGCGSLVGEQGTTYDASHMDAAYAHIDGGTTNPGYLSTPGTPLPSEAYVLKSSDGKVLTFYYDTQRSSRTGTTYSLNKGSNDPGWYKDDSYQNITAVVFDESFKDARPTSTSCWFHLMDNLTTITGIGNLNTSEVTYMSYMFSGCSALTSLDVSGFDTRNVTSMLDMFYDCSSLTSLDLSSFNTAKVTTMFGMFWKCSGLTSLNLSSFNTSNVTDMEFMFDGCKVLTTLDVSTFNTAKVTDMGYMFSNCYALTTLDLSSFNTANVTDMSYMFFYCSDLTRIYVDSGWSTASVTESKSMFSYCWVLVGGMGTKYNYENPNDKTYAHIDGGEGNPGYLTDYNHSPYAIVDGTTLTFYHDGQRGSRTVPTHSLNSIATYPSWKDQASEITEVVFDESFADVLPTSTYYWFGNMGNLTTITGIEYLNTSEVTDMSWMFCGCNLLTSLDLSSFNTENVTDMNRMFYYCINLTRIFVGSSWTTTNVTNSELMFGGCMKLVGCEGTSYEDTNPQDKSYAHIDGGASTPGYLSDAKYLKPYAALSSDGNTLTFYKDGQRLMRTEKTYFLNEGIDEPGWRVDRAGITTVVFDESFADARPVSTYSWFWAMTNLSNITGMEYLNTSEVTVMSSMFNGCRGMTSLDLIHFNTGKVTSMTSMFSSCTGLTSLDLTTFDTQNVTSTSGMFADCSNLTTVYVGDGWSTENVDAELSEHMFDGCTSLVGGMGTTFDTNHTDKAYARVDGGTSAPGYFYGTPAYAALSSDGKTLTFYCDMLRSTRGTTYDLNEPGANPGWYLDGSKSNVTAVVFDPSFAGARPIATNNWFLDMSSLTTITGMEYLNTSEVTDMSNMFNECEPLTSVDLSHFDTGKVTNMAWMFSYCEALTSLDLSSFNTANVTDMSYMFANCSSLTTLAVGDLNTGKVTNMSSMFEGCENLTEIDFSGYGFMTTLVTDMSNMFSGCESLTSINTWRAFANGTRNVTNMEGMFSNCRSLKTLDLTHFNTQSVTNMGYMFHGCKSLTEITLNMNYFTTANVTNMASMFDGCYALKSLDLSTFNTAKVTDMSYMFNECESLAKVDLSSFDTQQVTDMTSMFTGLHSMTLLDLSSFNTANVTKMIEMFGDCIELKTIFVGDGWSTANVSASNGMFNFCKKIVGGSGTTYSSSHIDKAYAHVDGGTSNPGYLTLKDDPYVVLSADGKTLTFYNDGQRTARNEASYDLNAGSTAPTWLTDASGVTKVVFDASFYVARPTSMYAWFSDMTNLKTFVGFDNLNTSSVTNMGSLFKGCSSLTTLELASFATRQVTDMSSMFQGCSSLKAVYVIQDYYYWETSDVESSENMFLGCTSIVGGSGTSYDANNIDKAYACIDAVPRTHGYFTYFGNSPYALLSADGTTLTFYKDGMRLTRTDKTYSLNKDYNQPDWNNDENNANITNVVFDASFAKVRLTSTFKWFSGMSQLANIAGMSNLNTSEVTTMSDMFEGCFSLTSLDLSHFNTTRVTDMTRMFSDCGTQTMTLDVSHFNTQNVTNMQGMFAFGKQTELDLSSFDTQNVTNMSGMFTFCPNLKTIYVSERWTVNGVTDSESMFFGCTSLVGSKGTTFDENHIDKAYAHIDGGATNPGYLSMVSVAYAVKSTDGTTLTFYYDDLKATRTGTTYNLNKVHNLPDWSTDESYQNITAVVFDSSFKDARPTTTSIWFSGMENLTSITGIGNLNTSEVTDMYGMFWGCSGLTSLDVSGFDTQNVTDMSWMFSNCSSLTSLDLSSFDTRNVKKMWGMFDNCSSLTSLDVSHFYTHNVTNMERMFSFCAALTSLNVSGFYTLDVETMYGMFYGCSTLTTLDLSSFNTAYVTNMNSMFGGCSGLTRIYVSNWWGTANVTDSEKMFNGCESLVGEQGTTYDASHVDATYAHIDGGTTNPGYLTMVSVAYAVKSTDNTTLTFYYDNLIATREGTKYDLNTGISYPGWRSDKSYKNITTVVFDSSFKDARPTTTSCWFDGMSNLTTITGISNLDTRDVTYMYGMFDSCGSLTALDVSGFNTQNVTNMVCMFKNCNSLTTLDLSSFDTQNVTGMRSMFNGCNVLTTLDLSSFNTANVTDMGYMFYKCSGLLRIFVDNGWSTASVTKSEYMFYDCSSLVGEQGTTYDASHVDAAYAHIDGGTTNPGYLSTVGTPLPSEAYVVKSTDDKTLTFYCDKLRSSRTGTTYSLNTGYSHPGWYTDKSYNTITTVVFDSSFIDARPISTRAWFAQMENLTSITGIGNLNTSEVTDMNYMFNQCSALTTLDVSHFDTQNVTNMIQMFDNCCTLTTLDVSHFNTAKVTRMDLMFSGCNSLTTLDVSNFDTQNVTDMSAMFYDCSSLTSLDLSSFNTANVTDMRYMFSECSGLTRIYVGSGWSTASVTLTNSEYMFRGCESLVGGKGTTFDENHIDKTYAHIDGGESNPGYLTEKPDFLLGDVNGDGKVDVADITALTNHLKGTTGNFNSDAADVDGDGQVTSADIPALVGIILGQ